MALLINLFNCCATIDFPDPEILQTGSGRAGVGAAGIFVFKQRTILCLDVPVLGYMKNTGIQRSQHMDSVVFRDIKILYLKLCVDRIICNIDDNMTNNICRICFIFNLIAVAGDESVRVILILQNDLGLTFNLFISLKLLEGHINIMIGQNAEIRALDHCHILCTIDIDKGLLELAGIPYVGCGVLASSVCMDKAVANALFKANGVPHTKWVAANRWEIEKDLEGVCAGVEAKLGWPVFVKPANAGSSVGISKVSSQEELKAAIALALENDRKVVFEAFVDGQEVECAVIGSDPAVATRPGEILAGAEFYTYDDKYKNGVSQTVIPAHLPEAKLDEVKTYAAMAYTALNCEGLARCDFFVEKNTGRVLINEINTFPGFTAISMYPKLMEHEGLPVPQLIDRLIALAVERTEKQHG